MYKIFLDMDGTIAKFNTPNAVARFAVEEGFFKKLGAYKGIEVINALSVLGYIYIVSASPHEKADNDKQQWINKYLPLLPKQNIIFTRLGENKAKEIEKRLNIKINNNCLLVDDYTKNLTDWEEVGGTGIKRLNKCADNSTGKWKGWQIKKLEQLVGIVL